MRLSVLTLFIASWMLTSISSWAAVPQATQPLPFLSDLRSENTHSLKDVEDAIDKVNVSEEPTSERLDFLKNREKELQARQIFLNRLILQFDLKFKGGDVQSFLRAALLDMAQIETEPAVQGTSMKEFLVQLAASMQSLPQGQVDVLKFVEGYMKRCSFQSPMSAEEYLSNLDYYNGVQAQKAHGMSPTEAFESL